MRVKKAVRKTKVVHCKKEPYDIYIGRPGYWGNPYSHLDLPHTKKVTTVQEAIYKYEIWIRGQPQMMRQVKKLKGKTLGCWCKPGPCHGDVLAKLADGDT